MIIKLRGGLLIETKDIKSVEFIKNCVMGDNYVVIEYFNKKEYIKYIKCESEEEGMKLVDLIYENI